VTGVKKHLVTFSRNPITLARFMKLSLHSSVILVTLVSFASTVHSASFDWPQWRGPDRSDVSKETGLLKSWPREGPRRVWLYENAGNGYSGPAIAGGKLYTMGTRGGSECVLALDATTGKELWAVKIARTLENDWGDGPRATPAVDGDQVYALSGEGVLAALNLTDGSIRWRKTMKELGGDLPGWGYCESPLVDGDRVLCTPGGERGTMAALDKKTGELVWQSREITDPAHYASIIPAEIHGTRQFIQLTEQSVFAITPQDGKLLWRAPWPGRTAVIPTPIHRDGKVYVTSGYGVGCMLISISRDFKPTTVYENRVMKNHHGGVVLVGDHLYGHAEPGWVCQKFDTGEEVWNHRSFGKGAVTSADGMLYCLDEGSGTVALVEASPKGWQEHGRFRLTPQSKIRSPEGRIWTHPVVSNGKLYLRDQEFIYCFDIKG
jgi:outer membrane protein assembly factor BamB